MQEHYYGGGKRKLSWWEIEEMKRNMQKVQTVEEKSQQYHQKEEPHIEKLLEQIEE